MPRKAKKLGLLERFAVVQNTSRPDKTFMYFDSDIALKLLEGLEQILDVEARVIHNNKEMDTRALTTSYDGEKDAEERDPFERATFYQNNQLVCLIVSENWTAIGGPKIYHDSVTLSVYSSADISEKLLVKLSDFGVVPTAIHRTKRLAEGRLESANTP